MLSRAEPQKDELVIKNLKLVHYLIRNKIGNAEEEYDDLVSIGTVGLIKAADTFDISKDIKFATYASRCIINEILMYLRKQKNKPISLETVVNLDGNGHELTLADLIADSDSDFEEEIEVISDFEKVINIILNNLKPLEKIVILYCFSGARQISISDVMGISQSYISRVETKVKKKIKKIFADQTKIYKGDYFMRMTDDLYKITFLSKPSENLKEALVNFITNLKSLEIIPDFNISCNQNRITIEIIANPENLAIIAIFVKEMDEFTLTNVKQKSTPKKDELLGEKDIEDSFEEEQEPIDSSAQQTNKKTTTKDSILKNVTKDNRTLGKLPERNSRIENQKHESSTSEDLIHKNSTTAKSTSKREGKATKVQEYMLTLDSFTYGDLKEHFPDLKYNDINNAVYLAKGKGLIKPKGKGEYEVIKT